MEQGNVAYQILDINGRAVGSIWAASFKPHEKQSGKEVWLCAPNGDYIASAWFGVRNNDTGVSSFDAVAEKVSE